MQTTIGGRRDDDAKVSIPTTGGKVSSVCSWCRGHSTMLPCRQVENSLYVDCIHNLIPAKKSALKQICRYSLCQLTLLNRSLFANSLAGFHQVWRDWCLRRRVICQGRAGSTPMDACSECWTARFRPFMHHEFNGQNVTIVHFKSFQLILNSIHGSMA